MSENHIKTPPDMLTAFDVDKVIREEIPSDKHDHWYLSMSQKQRNEAAKSLSVISQAICGKTKDDIIEHIDDRETVYMRTLKQAMDSLGEKFEESISSAIDKQGSINSDHNRRITDVEHTQKFYEHQLGHLRTSSENNVDLTKQVKELVLVLTERVEQGEKLFPSKSAESKPKKINISSIPPVGWVVMGIVSIAVLSLSTGHAAEFFEWLSSFKLGGVK